MKKRWIGLLMAVVLGCAVLGGCSSNADNENTTSAADTTAEESSKESTTEVTTVPEESSMQNTEEAKKVILVVSFGTSYNESRDITIGAIEESIADAFPQYEVRRAFTSQIIIDKLKERDGLEIDNMTEALDRLVADGVTEIVVQPTHLMHGYEYDDVMDELKNYLGKFDKIIVGEPLLNSDADFDAVISAITDATAEYSDEETAIVFMGHGTEHEDNVVYAQLQSMITADGYKNYYIGTVEATPSLDDVLALVKEGNYTKVVLEPLMVVAGDHANNDMAGDEEDSWKTQFEAENYEVECLIRGLGELEAVQQIYVEHVQYAIDNDVILKSDEANDTKGTNDDTEDTEESADLGEVLIGEQIADGTYEITVTSSSSMFKVVKAELQVEDGTMQAVLTLSGTGYEKLYMGTGEEAAAASDEDFIYFVADSEGAYTYTVPVEALNQETDVAAFSIKKQEWYDRVLVFESGMLPENAINR